MAATPSKHTRKVDGASLQPISGPVPWMIEAAALISLLRRDWSDFFVVAGLLVYNAAVGFWQEYKASNALDALKKGLAPKARVLRDGAWRTLDAADSFPATW